MRVLVVGTGKMGLAHLQVLSALGVDTRAAWAPSARRRDQAAATGALVLEGSLEEVLTAFGPTHVVIAAPVDALAATTMTALAAGVRHLLVEKPVALTAAEARAVAAAAAAADARVHVGYNRRFYGSVRSALARIVARHETVESVSFEFNETWGPAGPSNHAPCVAARWVAANSLHVIDMALLPVGLPDWGRSSCTVAGALPWHPAGRAFAGAGITTRGALFGYHADWNGPGRWAVEWVTPSARYVFRPLETLAVLRRGAATLEPIDPDDDLDQRFKPGVYRQDQAFLRGEAGAAATLDDAVNLLAVAETIAGYGAAGAR